jgi:Ni,Fe-hydrogenase III large subunit
MWAELNRIHSHLLWLGAFADAMGFEALFMQFWRIRELVLSAVELTSGNRIIPSTVTVGGVRRDVNEEMVKQVRVLLSKLETEFKKAAPLIEGNYTVKKRTVNIGFCSKDVAIKTSAVGPMIRGSGVESDIRTTKYSGYSFFDYKPIVDEGCDCYARTIIRVKETEASLKMVSEVLDLLPSHKDDILIKPDKWPEEIGLSRIEAPRGELFYYVKGNGTKYLGRVRIRVPTYANIPSLLAILPGCRIADVPVILLTIDPCMGCAERVVEM